LRNPPNDTPPVEGGPDQGPASHVRSSRAKSRGGRDESVPAPLDAVHPERPPQADSRGARDERSPERTCILSRRTGAREDLIRLALSPDGEILPDVRAKAPGRGAWIGVDRGALDEAVRKGKLKAALSRAFKTADIRIPDDLGARIEDALRLAVLDRLGLEARAGTLLTGAEKIETACRKGEVRLLLHAADAGEDGNRKLDQALRVGGQEGQGLVIPAQRTILSLALGRQNVVHIALIDRGAAARVGRALARWRAFIGPDSGLSAATAGASDAASVD
jgi:predicted RNA-binding protein YlxR (DUF448 family)